jgi:hypothetical protein
VIGSFDGTVDFDPGPGTSNQTSAGADDIFVAKYSATGSLLWARRMGGSGADAGAGIAVDGADDAYATGAFSGTATFGTTTLTSAGGLDIFVAKLTQSTGDAALRAPTGPIHREERLETLTPEPLQPIVMEAIARWGATGLGREQPSILNEVASIVTDLPDSFLGLASGVLDGAFADFRRGVLDDTLLEELARIGIG